MENLNENYSYSHANIIIWSLQQELNRYKARRLNDTNIEEYLISRISELKEYERQCLKTQAS